MPGQPQPTPSLDALCAAFGLSPHAVQTLDPAYPAFDAQRPLLVLPGEFEAARPLLVERYPSAHRLLMLTAAGPAASTIEAAGPQAAAWLVDPLPVEADVRSLAGLRGIIDRLAGPDGCPWDREQTPDTLRKYLLEETYEVVDAIDRGDLDGLREELGDVLIHVLMQGSLARERGDFTLEDIVQASATKMVRRHPHVFGGEVFESNERLLDRWEQIKSAERAGAGAQPRSAIEAVPLALPALQRTQALIGRSQRIATGAATPDTAPNRAPDNISDLAAAVMTALEALIATDDGQRPVHLGRLLFTLVAYARAAGIDAEEALRLEANRFAARLTALLDASPPAGE